MPVPLPNSDWARSEKKPEWALCLDPADDYFGWKFYECNGRWVSGGELSQTEVEQALKMPALKSFAKNLQTLLERNY